MYWALFSTLEIQKLKTRFLPSGDHSPVGVWNFPCGLWYIDKQDELCVPSGRNKGQGAKAKERMEHSGSCQFLYFPWEASSKYVGEGEEEESMHGFCEVAGIGEFIGTESRIEVTRAWGHEGRRVIVYGYTVFIGDEEKALDTVMMFVQHRECF